MYELELLIELMELECLCLMAVEALEAIVVTVRAVSYTHLDVYKRQLQHHALFVPKIIITASE